MASSSSSSSSSNSSSSSSSSTNSSSSSSSNSSSSSSQSLSSWSSYSDTSSSSHSSSSSSWSSESSAWDTNSAQAHSYLVVKQITVTNNIFTASCMADIRWRDAAIIAARGPLLADVGGTFGNEWYPKQIVSWIDGLTITKTWTVLEDAQAWQAAIEDRLQTAMELLRELYAQYPGAFTDRTRTV